MDSDVSTVSRGVTRPGCGCGVACIGEPVRKETYSDEGRYGFVWREYEGERVVSKGSLGEVNAVAKLSELALEMLENVSLFLTDHGRLIE